MRRKLNISKWQASTIAISIVLTVPFGFYWFNEPLNKIHMPFPWDLLTGPIFGVFVGWLLVKANVKLKFVFVLLVLLLLVQETRHYFFYPIVKSYTLEHPLISEFNKAPYRAMNTYYDYRLHEFSLLNEVKGIGKFTSFWIIPVFFVYFLRRLNKKRKADDLIDQQI
jgi:hypothetical protein